MTQKSVSWVSVEFLLAIGRLSCNDRSPNSKCSLISWMSRFNKEIEEIWPDLMFDPFHHWNFDLVAHLQHQVHQWTQLMVYSFWPLQTILECVLLPCESTKCEIQQALYQNGAWKSGTCDQGQTCQQTSPQTRLLMLQNMEHQPLLQLHVPAVSSQCQGALLKGPLSEALLPILSS